MSFCCIRSCRDKQRGSDHRSDRCSAASCTLWYLVKDVPLAAEIQVRQDPGGSDVGDRQAGLRDTGGDQGGLPLTETRKQMGELQETT